jgi:hypothetical protein
MMPIPMTHIKKHEPTSSLLRAIFKYGVVSFRLTDTTTLGDIAQRLDDVRASHIGAPVSINVRFDTVADDRLKRRHPIRRHRAFQL